MITCLKEILVSDHLAHNIFYPFRFLATKAIKMHPFPNFVVPCVSVNCVIVYHLEFNDILFSDYVLSSVHGTKKAKFTIVVSFYPCTVFHNFSYLWLTIIQKY